MDLGHQFVLLILLTINKHEPFHFSEKNSCNLKTKITRERGINLFLKCQRNIVDPTRNA